MKTKHVALLLIAVAFAALVGLSGCAVSYPYKNGTISLEFAPTPEMLNMAGVKLNPRTLRDK
jgi:hypothetical protein